MQLQGVVAQPAPPEPVIGPPAGHDLPEARAVAEDAKMGQLVDDHGLERLGRRQDETPREGEAPRSGAAAPASPGIADRDRGRGYGQRRRVAFDLAIDRDAGSLAQPRLEDRGQAPSLRLAQTHDQLVAGVATFAAHGRAAPLGTGHHPKTVGLAAEPEEAAVAEGTQRRQLLALARLPLELPAEPRLAVRHERLRQPLGLTSVSGRPGGHGHDGRVSGIDRQSEVPRPRRSPKRAFEAAIGKP